MQRTFCDRCGRWTDDTYKYRSNSGLGPVRVFELCKTCHGDFMEWLYKNSDAIDEQMSGLKPIVTGTHGESDDE